MIFDVCVVGLGGIGSAIAAHCAARGARVIGLEQFPRAHELGSSAGKSRMIRAAYFEDPGYVPLVLRAYELWRELGRDVDEKLLTITGVLTVGRDSDEIITGTLRAAREHNLPIECLTRDDVRQRHPMLQVQPHEIAIFEPDAGVLKPERAIAAHLAVAERSGATLRFDAAMTRWQRAGATFDVQLNDGSSISARSVILALGPWVQRALAELGLPIRVQRNVQAWFAPATNDYAAPRFPAFLLNRKGLPAPLYGFPDFADGVKAAFHGAGEVVDPQHVQREISEKRDVEPIVRAMQEWMPDATTKFLGAKVCMYSLTPDHHFVIDRHPDHERLIVCGGFSGHGFKFAPVIGEIAADLAIDGRTRHPIEFLSLRRFNNSKVEQR